MNQKFFWGFLIPVFSFFCSCSPKQGDDTLMKVDNSKEEIKSRAYDQLFSEINDFNEKYVLNFSDIDLLMLDNNGDITSFRTTDNRDSVLLNSKTFGWFKNRIRDIVVVAADAVGSVIGASIGGFIGCSTQLSSVCSVWASSKVADALGVSYEGKINSNGVNHTICIPLSSVVVNNVGIPYTIGEFHNIEMHHAMVLQKKENSFELLKQEVAEKYEFNIQKFPKTNPVESMPEKLIRCMNDPNLNSFDEVITNVSKETGLSEENSKFIILSIVNNLILLDRVDDDLNSIKEYNISLSEIVNHSSVPDRQNLINCTSVLANSNVFWNYAK